MSTGSSPIRNNNASQQPKPIAPSVPAKQTSEPIRKEVVAPRKGCSSCQRKKP